MDIKDLPAGLAIGDDGLLRCWWCVGDPLYQRYHDDEWGRPVGDDRRLFEVICLEAFQSGLSWLTILRKREGFRRAFADWHIATIARFDERDVERLMADASIVRNRAKIAATINNARHYPAVVERYGSLAAFVWSYEPEAELRPATLDYDRLMAISTTSQSRTLSRDLRRLGWAFVGPTTAYSAMEAVGLVNDHLEGCSVRDDVEAARAAFARPRADTGGLVTPVR
jgi:DNA-3-methyladenine glycosylase I